jgi:acetyl esterase/lipase
MADGSLSSALGEEGADSFQAEKMMGGRVTISANDVEECRAHFMGIAASVRASLPEPTAAVKTEDVEISPSHRVRIYIPTAAGDSLPVGLYIHSGGWYTGSIETEDFLCHMIAEQSQIILFSPEYRLAPENPYPAGLEDCCKAYEFMHAVASNYGGNPKKSFIMGGSAGGNLAACVALKYVSNAKLKLSGLIVACMVSCDPKALPGEYKKKYSSMGYRGTPLIDDISVQNARGKVSSFI